jgi:uncharacterized protein
MLNLSLSAVARGPVRIQEEIPPDHPAWDGSGIALEEPLKVDLEARPVGEGVLVRGEMRTVLSAECRRCLTPLSVPLEDTVDLLYEPLSEDEEVELGGEVYPIPALGDRLDLGPAIRELLLLRRSEFVVCSEHCRGLCSQCGTDLNVGACECVPEPRESSWGALKNIKFD